MIKKVDNYYSKQRMKKKTCKKTLKDKEISIPDKWRRWLIKNAFPCQFQI